jgi:hypothetical protein
MRSFLVLGIVLSSFTSAFAQSAESVFEKFDRDGDGRVTSEELPSKPTFQRYDTNKDGAITLAEYKAVIGNTPAESPLRRLGKKGGATANAPSIKPEDLKKITSGPEVLKPGEVGIGRMIPDVAFTDLAGKSHRLSDSRKGTVIIMTSATCPVSKRYASSIAELHKEIAGQGLTLLLVNPLASEKPEEIKAQLAAAGLTATYVQDKEKALAGALEARTTTEVFLLDAARTLVYRGAFDDQYGINYNLHAPKHRYLRDAIAAFLLSLIHI